MPNEHKAGKLTVNSIFYSMLFSRHVQRDRFLDSKLQLIAA